VTTPGAEVAGRGFTHRHTIRVRYAETDAMGVVYYANYLTYFEVARVEYLRAAGIRYRALEGDGTVAAVTAAHVDYHAPARFDDELSLWTRCVSMGKVRFRIEYEVHREADDVRVASGYTEHALLAHETLRPVRIPAWVKSGIEQFEARQAAPHPTMGPLDPYGPPARAPASTPHPPPPSPASGRGGEDLRGR
jgi:acyl-CoA thioester hydrolase